MHDESHCDCIGIVITCRLWAGNRIVVLQYLLHRCFVSQLAQPCKQVSGNALWLLRVGHLSEGHSSCAFENQLP